MDEKCDFTFEELCEMFSVPTNRKVNDWLIPFKEEELLKSSTEKLLFLTNKLKQESELLTQWFNFLTDKLTDPVLSVVDADFYMKHYQCLLPTIDVVENNKHILKNILFRLFSHLPPTNY